MRLLRRPTLFQFDDLKVKFAFLLLIFTLTDRLNDLKVKDTQGIMRSDPMWVTLYIYCIKQQLPCAEYELIHSRIHGCILVS